MRVPQEGRGEASERDDQQPGTQTGGGCKEDARLSTLSGVNKNKATPLYEQRKHFSQSANVVFHRSYSVADGMNRQVSLTGLVLLGRRTIPFSPCFLT